MRDAGTKESSRATNSVARCRKDHRRANGALLAILELDAFAARHCVARRILANARTPVGNGNGTRQLQSPLLPGELTVSLVCLVKLEQSRFFRSEMALLRSGTAVSKGTLPRLNPFLDDDGQLRVGGCIMHAVLAVDAKHPVIIHRDSPLTLLLVDDGRTWTLHGGTQLTLATLRQRFWIISGRSVGKTFIGRCIRYLRFRDATATQLMGISLLSASIGHGRFTTREPTMPGRSSCGLQRDEATHCRRLTSRSSCASRREQFISKRSPIIRRTGFSLLTEGLSPAVAFAK